jgi:O-antigen ligase
MDLKHVIFIALTLAFIPGAVFAAISFRWAERLLVAGALFSTTYLVDINFVSMEWYRGDTRGFEIGITDWMIVSLMVVMLVSPRWKNRTFTFKPPNISLMALYFALCFISMIPAEVPLYSGFGLSKIARGFLVYLVAYNYLRSEKDLHFIILLLASIIFFQFLFCAEQRLTGVYRVYGSTPHSNTLAGYVNILNMIFLAIILTRSNPHPRICYIALAMGTLIVLATFSRGALGAMAGGYALVVFLSFKDRISVKKLKIIGVCTLLTIPLAIKAAPSVIDRFINAPESSSESRKLANKAAIAMANDHFFGVGLNNYSHSINETAYSKFIEKEVDRGIVHNIYLLQASETGWIGMVVFVLMAGNFIRLGMQQINRHSDSLASAFAVGITSAMIVLWSQGFLEWVFRQTYITVEFFLLAGFLTALTRVEKASQKQIYYRNYWRQMWTQNSPSYQS